MNVRMHFQKRKRLQQRVAVVDSLMMIAAVVHPLSALPQVITIYVTRQAEGVSLITWISFMLLGVLYLYYAYLHKLKPLIVTQVIWFAIDLLVVVGVLLYGS